MSGSEDELVPLPTQAAEQMRDATDTLRDQVWMIAPFTSPQMLPEQPTAVEADDD